ncbi:MAG: oligosaccharide flippase family protein [Bacteroidales bacterium]|nr:oligosaccharide flippase family protein [Bacteroidales bacterium]
MRKKFLENLIFLLFLNFLIKPFWILGVDRQVQNMLGATEYGFYFSIFNFSYLFYIFLDLGITNFNNRNIARNAHLLESHFGGIATLKLLLGVVYALLLFLVGWVIGYDDRQMHLMFWVAINLFLISFILYLRSNISGLLHFKTDSVLSVLDKFLLILLVGLFLLIPVLKKNFTVFWFVYAQTAAYLVTALAALVVLLRKSKKLSLRWDWRFFLHILKKSFPFALLALIMGIYTRVDSVLIERLLPDPLGEQQAGVYAQAFRLLDAGQNISYLFAVLLLPIFSRMLKEKSPVGSLVKLSFSILITGTLIVAITSHFFARDLMHLMYSRYPGETVAAYALRLDQSAYIFKLLMWTLVAASSNYIFGTLLTANNNLKMLNIIALSGLVLNFVFNFILIPVMQARGAAVATLITQGFIAVVQLSVAVFVLKLKWNGRLILGLVLLGVSLYLSGILLGFATGMGWWQKWGLLIFVGVVLSFVFRLLNWKGFYAILKERTQG